MNEWIEVQPEQLPPESPEPHTFIQVLMYVPELDKGTVLENGVCVGYYVHQLGQWRVGTGPSSWKATHWQPMPQPPT